MFLTATQGPSATPRPLIPLFVPAVRTKLIRLFYVAFPTKEIQQNDQLTALEAVLLSNACDGSPLSFLASRSVLDLCVINKEAASFAASLIACSPHSDDLITIRDQIIGSLNEENFFAVKILLACPLKGVVSSDLRLTSFCVNELKREGKCNMNILALVISIFQNCTDSDLAVLLAQEAEGNLFLALADLAVPNRCTQPIYIEELSKLRERQEALSALAVAVFAIPNPISLLSLRKDKTDRTIGQKIFDVLFSELMLETYLRKQALPNVYGSALKIRLRRLNDSTNILVRMAYVMVETGHTQSPLEDYSALIPSLFGLIKALMAKRSEATHEIDETISSLLLGDLCFLKELSAPEFIGTPFELEQSVW